MNDIMEILEDPCPVIYSLSPTMLVRCRVFHPLLTMWEAYCMGIP